MKFIPLSALVGISELALTSLKTNTRKFNVDGKAVEGEVGDHKIEFVIMDNMEKLNVSVKTLAPEIAKITTEQIEDSLPTRKYILLEFEKALATPYANKSGFGVSYSIKADSVRLVKPKAPATASKSAKA